MEGGAHESLIPLILHGCNLAKDIELNLPNLTNQPGFVLSSCEEIVKVFGQVVARMNTVGRQITYSHAMLGERMDMRGGEKVEVGEREEVFGGGYRQQALDLLRVVQNEVAGPEINKGEGSGAEGSESGKRPRKRKDDKDKYTRLVPAPRSTNLETPPDDGFTWRKYGQKEILGSKFPRSYYRCTHSKFYGCGAKKQVQRTDNDPFMFEVTYRSMHTCNTSISFADPSLDNKGGEVSLETHVSLPSTSIKLAWLPMELDVQEKDKTTLLNPLGLQIYQCFTEGGEGTRRIEESSLSNRGRSETLSWLSKGFDQREKERNIFLDTLKTYASGDQGRSGGVESSNARSGREMDFPVLDLADVMFNSQISNNMDEIFTSRQEH